MANHTQGTKIVLTASATEMSEFGNSQFGAFVGGFIFSYIQNKHVTFRFDMWSFLVAFVGAVVLLLVFRLIAWLFSGGSR